MKIWLAYDHPAAEAEQPRGTVLSSHFVLLLHAAGNDGLLPVGRSNSDDGRRGDDRHLLLPRRDCRKLEESRPDSLALAILPEYSGRRHWRALTVQKCRKGEINKCWHFNDGDARTHLPAIYR